MQFIVISSSNSLPLAHFMFRTDAVIIYKHCSGLLYSLSVKVGKCCGPSVYPRPVWPDVCVCGMTEVGICLYMCMCFLCCSCFPSKGFYTVRLQAAIPACTVYPLFCRRYSIFSSFLPSILGENQG